MWWRILAVTCALGLAVTAVLTAPATVVGQRGVVVAALPCRPSLQTASSGFVVDDELVVTVAHAIYESRDFAIRDVTGRWYRPEIVHMDLDLDLAVLRVPGLRARPMTTRRALPEDLVRMVQGAASGTSEGVVLRRVRLTTETIGDLSRKTERSGYELSVAIQGGDSGAAVVDTYDNLIGVVFARSRRSEASWATSASEVLRVLDQQGIPHWQCENSSEVELILEPLNLDDPSE
ncbi:MAG: S1 family peptidase [Acidimicrobiales bacterium]